DREATAIRERAGDFRRGRAAGEPDDHALGDACGGLAGNPPLLVAVARAPVAQWKLVEHPVCDGAAVRPRQQALILEQLEVAPKGGGRRVHLRGEVRDADTAVRGQALENGG